MKRVILSVAALAIGSFAFAQTPQTIAAPVQQVSPTATAIIGGNFSDIDQKGVGSDATVQQQGTANASFIEQTGTDAANRNNVDVLQWGNVQPSISGHLNYSDILQNGAGNDFMVTQQGDLNEVFGTQSGLDNTAIVQQGADAPQQAESNLSLVDQDGKDNFAEVQQRYDNSKASILQRNDVAAGVGNRSYQEQIADPNMSSGHVAIGTQYGDGNTLVQMQQGGPLASGSGNYAEASQGDAIDDATNAFAQQLQQGDVNEAYVTQKGTDNTSFQEQSGNQNLAQVTQANNPVNGSNLYAEQYQEGTINVAKTEQNGANHESYQEQNGYSNLSVVFQRGGVNPADGNVAISMQEGTFNNSFISQKARGNHALVDQTGDGQTSTIEQNINSNSAPNGDGFNTASVIQRNANVPLTPQIQRAAATRRHF
ncbi:MAG: hypothetical protein ACSHWW_08540 [Nonlabens sp.]|uniref:hypothetical protein n=1 Tax=Nonlabens sp. TaxID=1888209 RepID=UPI003EF21931